MLKKIYNLFFDEVEEKEDKEEVVEKIKKPVEKVSKPTEKVVAKKPTVEKKVVKEPIDKVSVVKEDITSEKKSIFIDNTIEFKKVKEEKVVEEITSEDYEFTPIISPIRGLKDKDKKTYVVNKSKKEIKTSTSHLGTIISPIYGLQKGSDQGFIEKDDVEIVSDVTISDKQYDSDNLTLEQMLSNTTDQDFNKTHFLVGIKGTGMSALATLLKSANYQVMGSDTNNFVFTEVGLKNDNIKVVDFDANNIKDNMIVIVGNSFDDSHPEVIMAKNNPSIKVYTYPQYLGKFIEGYSSIAVSGSHGKTTTTSMISDMIGYSQPIAYLIGDGRGQVESNAKDIVIEACEYKRNFLNYPADYGIITNLEWDHVDYYLTNNDYLYAFEQFANQIKDTVLIFGDDKDSSKLNIKTNTIYYGENSDNDLQATNIIEDQHGSNFDVIYKGEFISNFKIKLIGRHMIYNALASIGIGLLKGLTISEISEGLNNYQGARRRFEISEIGDSIVIDDYAHHPTEVNLTIQAAKTKYPNHQIVAIYHPDRIKRLNTFIDEYLVALKLADQVVVGSAVDSDGMTKEIDLSPLVDNLDDVIVVDDDSESVAKLYDLVPAVFLFMGTKEMHYLKKGLIDYLKRIDI